MCNVVKAPYVPYIPPVASLAPLSASPTLRHTSAVHTTLAGDGIDSTVFSVIPQEVGILFPQTMRSIGP